MVLRSRFFRVLLSSHWYVNVGLERAIAKRLSLKIGLLLAVIVTEANFPNVWEEQ
jgi:hypothetical protein